MEVCHARERYVRWLLVARDLSPHTVRAYGSDVAAFERHLGARALVHEIDHDRVMAFIEAQRAAGLCSTSIRRRASGLRGFCNWLLHSRLLDADPWAGATVAVGRPRKLPRLVPTQDLDRLLVALQATAAIGDGCRPHAVLDRPHEATTLLAVALMVATGLRVSEVASIRCPDIDLASRSLRIVGKGRRERQVFLTNDWINTLTSAYLQTRAALGINHTHLLFNRLHAPMTAPAMRARLSKAAQDAGLGARVTPHMLRHTAATQLIEAGVDIRYIQRLLGHASLSTTEIYTHVSDRALKRVVSEADVLGRLMRPR
jgi:integrase/recombinase XerD